MTHKPSPTKSQLHRHQFTKITTERK